MLKGLNIMYSEQELKEIFTKSDNPELEYRRQIQRDIIRNIQLSVKPPFNTES